MRKDVEMENDQERSTRYNYLFQRGWLTLNEVRLLCGLLPLEADLQLIFLENKDLPSNQEGLNSPYQERR